MLTMLKGKVWLFLILPYIKQSWMVIHRLLASPPAPNPDQWR